MRRNLLPLLLLAACCSTVRLLETSTSRAATKFFWFATPWVCHDEGPVICHEDIFDLFLRCLINVFLIVCNDSFRNSLTQCIDLGGITSTLDAKPNINLGATILAEQQQGLIDLDAEDVWLQSVDGAAIDTNKPTSSANQRNSNCRLLPPEALYL